MSDKCHNHCHSSPGARSHLIQHFPQETIKSSIGNNYLLRHSQPSLGMTYAPYVYAWEARGMQVILLMREAAG